MVKQQKGSLLIDLLITGAIILTFTVISLTVVYRAAIPFIERIKVEDYSKQVFIAMEEHYWNAVRVTGCIQPPASVDVQILIDEGLLDESLIKNSFFEGSKPSLSFTTTTDAFLPTGWEISLNIKNKAANNTRSLRFFSSEIRRTFDDPNEDQTYGTAITLRKINQSQLISNEYLATLNSSGCKE